MVLVLFNFNNPAVVFVTLRACCVFHQGGAGNKGDKGSSGDRVNDD